MELKTVFDPGETVWVVGESARDGAWEVRGPCEVVGISVTIAVPFRGRPARPREILFLGGLAEMVEARDAFRDEAAAEDEALARNVTRAVGLEESTPRSDSPSSPSQPKP